MPESSCRAPAPGDWDYVASRPLLLLWVERPQVCLGPFFFSAHRCHAGSARFVLTPVRLDCSLDASESWLYRACYASHVCLWAPPTRLTATDIDMKPLPGDNDESPDPPARREPGHKLPQLLRADIVAGRIPAGSRLKVSDIIARYGTSTNPAREALHALEGEGLVVITPNRGARVRSINDDFVGCIFDIRRLVEPYIVRWFAEYATAEDRSCLVAIQEAVQQAAEAGNFTEFHKLNCDFHDLIVNRHFNIEAARIMRTQNGWLRLLAVEYPSISPQIQRSSAEHWELIAAFKSFDADLAAKIILKHGERSQTNLLGRMQRKRAEIQANGS